MCGGARTGTHTLSNGEVGKGVITRRVHASLRGHTFTGSADPSSSPLHFQLGDILPLPVVLPLLCESGTHISVGLPAFCSGVAFPFHPAGHHFYGNCPLAFSNNLRAIGPGAFAVTAMGGAEKCFSGSRGRSRQHGQWCEGGFNKSSRKRLQASFNKCPFPWHQSNPFKKRRHREIKPSYHQRLKQTTKESQLHCPSNQRSFAQYCF